MKLCKILLIAVCAVGVTQAAEQAVVPQGDDDIEALMGLAAQDWLPSMDRFDSPDCDAKKREEAMQQLAEQQKQQEAQKKALERYKELCDACGSKSPESLPTVKALLAKGVGLKLPYPTAEEPRTPLGEAIYSGSVETAQFLIDNGADVKDKYNWHQAIQVCSLPMVKLLVLNKADLTETVYSYRDLTLLMFAITPSKHGKNDIEIMKYLLSQGADTTQTVCLSDGPRTFGTIYDFIAGDYVDFSQDFRERVIKILDTHRTDGGDQLMMSLPRFSKDLVKMVAGYAGFSVE